MLHIQLLLGPPFVSLLMTTVSWKNYIYYLLSLIFLLGLLFMKAILWSAEKDSLNPAGQLLLCWYGIYNLPLLIWPHDYVQSLVGPKKFRFFTLVLLIFFGKMVRMGKGRVSVNNGGEYASKT